VEALALGLSLGLGAGLAPGPLLALVVGATLERGFAAGARVAEPGVAPADLRRAVLVNALSPHPWLFWITVGGPLLVADGFASGAAFLAGFYATLVGAKVAIAGVVAAGRRRGAGRLVPGPLAARLGTGGALQRLGGVRIVSAVLLSAAALALLADGISRLG
jgi:threonine/homoserine/homoserine lactone efflux protein